MGRYDRHEVIRDADVLVHMAWLFQPTHRPEATWRNNVLGAIRVFETVADEAVPALVYASSVTAYSPGPSAHPVDEHWPTHGGPGAAYPREKAYPERWLDAYEARHPNLRIVRLRPGFIFKRESATAQRRLFLGPLLPRRLVRPGLIPVVPALTDLRLQVLHTEDAVAAYMAAIRGAVHGPINLAAEPPVDSDFLAEFRCPAGAGPADGAAVRAGHRVSDAPPAKGTHPAPPPTSPGLQRSLT
ncbi:NAD-dependent epimerase/dehydratase family protein [Rhodococcus sp. T2V]|nr:NAD-dependent epimerase/dehydratase family protein [Rhodococcus sp. T2V]MDF3312598.1 NAD-dependent epimerase/dehydratase family protein [Rhodococcus sp. T2V]